MIQKGIGIWEIWQGSRRCARRSRSSSAHRTIRRSPAHTSQVDWTPDITPALFVVVSLDEWPEFVQPTGAHDAYNKGDKVTFEGKHYISLIDGNVYSPTAYPAGWQEQA